MSTHFAEDKKTGTLRLGLYGMGGIGKTTLCKDLCHHFQKDFSGRVCHVDFGEPSDAVLRQKQVLGELCSIRDEELDRIKDTHTVIQLHFSFMCQVLQHGYSLTYRCAMRSCGSSIRM